MTNQLRPVLQDAVLLVLGGSSGIGLATARQAASAGAAVALVARNAARLSAAAEDVRAAARAAHRVRGPADGNEPALVSTHAADVNVSGDLRNALDDATRAHGRVDHVLFAAGAAELAPLLDGRTLDAQFAPIEQRLRSAVTTIRTLAPGMRPGGSFVLIGGISTDRPVKGAWATGVGTAAAEQLARTLALEIAPLRANAISPGWIDTPMWDGVLGDAKHQVFESVVARTPIGRFATVDETANAALFLMQNGGITGAVLHIDGGQRLT